MIKIGEGLVLLPIRRDEITHAPEQAGAKKVSRTVRPDGRRIEYADLGRRTAAFFRNAWRDFKDLLLPVEALGWEQKDCLKILQGFDIGNESTRPDLAREMTRVFNRKYEQISVYGVLGHRLTRMEAGAAAAKAAVNSAIKREKANNSWIPVEKIDLLREKMVTFKEPSD